MTNSFEKITKDLSYLGLTQNYSVDIINSTTDLKDEFKIITIPEIVLNIKGWVFDEKKNDIAGDVYINIDGEILNAEYGILRNDVADKFKNIKVKNSGFRSIISSSKIGTGLHLLSLLIVDKDKKNYFTSQRKYIINIVHSKSGINYSKSFESPKLSVSATTKKSSKTINNIDTMKDYELLFGKFELFVANIDNLELTGWAIDDEQKDCAGGAIFEIDNTIYPALYGIERKDVEDNLKSEKFRFSGFELSLPIELLGKGIHDINLKIIGKDNKSFYEANPFKLTLK